MSHPPFKLTLLAASLVWVFSNAKADAEAVAFVSEATSSAVVVHADGTSEPLQIGSQLSAGDELNVTEGQAVLIYLSGRSVIVKQGEPYSVAADEDNPSPSHIADFEYPQ